MDKSAMMVIGQLHKGGAERQLYLLARDLVRRGWRIAVATLSEGGDWQGPLREAGVAVHELPTRTPRMARRLLGLRSLIRREHPAILHSWMWHGNVYAGLAARGLGLRGRVACERVVDPTRRPWQARLDLWAGRGADWMVCNSRDGAGWLTRCGWPSERLKVIHNGLEPFPPSSAAVGAALRAEFALPPGAPLVLGAGRLERQKRPQDFVEVCASVARLMPEAHFALAGEGALRGELQSQVERLGLDKRFHFLGVRADLADWMREASLILHTTAYEGLSNVLLEASLLGRPIVATRATGNDEIVEDGESGLLLPVGDVAGLAAGALDLLRQPARAEGLGRRAAGLAAERFSTPAMVEAWEALYLGLLAGCLKQGAGRA